MTIEKVDHIGVAVENLEESISLYTVLMGKGPDHIEEVASEKVKTAFFQAGDSSIELLQGLSSESPISKFIEKNGRGGVHHICLQVSDIEAKLAELKNAGLTLIDETPKKGAHGKLIAFVHPKALKGVLIELSQIEK